MGYPFFCGFTFVKVKYLTFYNTLIINGVKKLLNFCVKFLVKILDKRFFIYYICTEER